MHVARVGIREREMAGSMGQRKNSFLNQPAADMGLSYCRLQQGERLILIASCFLYSLALGIQPCGVGKEASSKWARVGLFLRTFLQQWLGFPCSEQSSCCKWKVWPAGGSKNASGISIPEKELNWSPWKARPTLHSQWIIQNKNEIPTLSFFSEN